MPWTRLFERQYTHFLHFYGSFRSFCKQKQHFSTLSLSSHFLLGPPFPPIPDPRIVQLMVPCLISWSRSPSYSSHYLCLWVRKKCLGLGILQCHFYFLLQGLLINVFCNFPPFPWLTHRILNFGREFNGSRNDLSKSFFQFLQIALLHISLQLELCL